MSRNEPLLGSESERRDSQPIRPPFLALPVGLDAGDVVALHELAQAALTERRDIGAVPVKFTGGEIQAWLQVAVHRASRGDYAIARGALMNGMAAMFEVLRRLDRRIDPSNVMEGGSR